MGKPLAAESGEQLNVMVRSSSAAGWWSFFATFLLYDFPPLMQG